MWATFSSKLNVVSTCFFFFLFSLPTYFLPLVNFLIENWSRGLSFESSGMFSSNSFRSLFSITIIAKFFVLTLQYFPVNGAPVKIYTGTLSKGFLKIYFYFLLKKFQENITVKCFLLWSATFVLMLDQVFLSLNMIASKKKTLWVEDHFIPFCVYFIWKSRSRQKRFLVSQLDFRNSSYKHQFSFHDFPMYLTADFNFMNRTSTQAHYVDLLTISFLRKVRLL